MKAAAAVVEPKLKLMPKGAAGLRCRTISTLIWEGLTGLRPASSCHDVTASLYGSCLENKKLGVGFKFLSYRVFRGYEGGYEGVRDRFPVGDRRD